MTLISLPDAKTVRKYLRVGQDYPILGAVGNGYIIQPEGCPDRLVLVASRFKENGSD